MNLLKRFAREENGQDLVEYGLLASLISIVAIAAMLAIGPLVNNLYVTISNQL